MQYLLWVGIGSFVGGCARYGLSLWVQSKVLSAYPYGTLSVNIIGCLLVGVFFGLSERYQIASEWRLLLVTGFCGGFTTFSAFSLETMALLRNGQFIPTFIYVAVSLLFGLFATFSGYALQKLF